MWIVWSSQAGQQSIVVVWAWFWVPVWYACNRLPLAHLACSGVTSPPLYHTGPYHAWGSPHWLVCCCLVSSGFGPCLKFLGTTPLDYAAWYLALGRGNGRTRPVLGQCPSPPGVHVRDCATHVRCARTPGLSFASRPHHSPQRVDRAHDGYRPPFVVVLVGVPPESRVFHLWVIFVMYGFIELPKP